MTADPLIDKATLFNEICKSLYQTHEVAPEFEIFDAVVAYLRSVLTPATLDPPGDVPVFVQIGDDWVKIADLLHRRIWGG